VKRHFIFISEVQLVLSKDKVLQPQNAAFDKKNIVFWPKIQFF